LRAAYREEKRVADERHAALTMQWKAAKQMAVNSAATDADSAGTSVDAAVSVTAAAAAAPLFDALESASLAPVQKSASPLNKPPAKAKRVSATSPAAAVSASTAHATKAASASNTAVTTTTTADAATAATTAAADADSDAEAASTARAILSLPPTEKHAALVELHAAHLRAAADRRVQIQAQMAAIKQCDENAAAAAADADADGPEALARRRQVVQRLHRENRAANLRLALLKKHMKVELQAFLDAAATAVAAAAAVPGAAPLNSKQKKVVRHVLERAQRSSGLGADGKNAAAVGVAAASTDL
jgi:hypothetical protein